MAFSGRRPGKISASVKARTRSFEQLPTPTGKGRGAKRVTPCRIVMTGTTGVVGSAIVAGIIKQFQADIKKTTTDEIKDSIQRGERPVPWLEIHCLVREESSSKFDAQKAKWDKIISRVSDKECKVIVYSHWVDLSNSMTIASFLKMFNENFKDLDLFIHAASIAPKTKEMVESEKLEKQFVVNVLSAHRLTKGLVPLLESSRRKGGARVIYVSSKDAKYLKPNDLNFNERAYSATNAFYSSMACLRVLTIMYEEQWRQEQSKVKRTSFFSVHPGQTASPLMANLGVTHGTQTPDESAENPVYVAMTFDDRLKFNVHQLSGSYFAGKKTSICKFAMDSDAKKRDRASVWAICERHAQWIRPFQTGVELVSSPTQGVAGMASPTKKYGAIGGASALGAGLAGAGKSAYDAKEDEDD